MKEVGPSWLMVVYGVSLVRIDNVRALSWTQEGAKQVDVIANQLEVK